jgi:two-component system, response regulator PdtaR
MNPLNRTVLVVDDEFIIAQGLQMQVEDMGLTVCGTAATAEAAIALAKTYRPAVILMDVRLDGALDGVDAALAIHQTVGAKIIFITGSREESTRARIAMDHPTAVLFKPISSLQLKRAVDDALGD